MHVDSQPTGNTRSYEYDEFDFIQRHFGLEQRLDQPIVDIGSHYGEFGKRFLQAGFTVYSFEPTPATNATQTERLMPYVQNGRLRLFPFAASDRDGLAEFHLGSADTLNTLERDWTTKGFPEHFQSSSTIQVVTRKMGDFLTQLGLQDVLLLKIDTEGHDHNALRGLLETSATPVRPQAVMFEIYKPFEENIFASIRLLQAQGYTRFAWFVKYGEELLFHAVYGDDTKDARLDAIPLYCGNVIAVRGDSFPTIQPDRHAPAQPSDLDALREAGLWQPGQPLRLHLGCGEQYLPGYVNIDHPPSEHQVMQPKADCFADLTELQFPPGSLDEIRLHHVFEHFNRVTAIALLIRWQTWLKVGGKLHIETPDLIGSARTLLSDASYKVKMGVVRHLEGDQVDRWAYHIGQWFPERFERDLGALGFDVQARAWSWPHEPYLSNVEAIATKQRDVSEEELLSRADELLWNSTVAAAEAPTHEAWRRQLREALAGFGPKPAAPASAPEVTASVPVAPAPSPFAAVQSPLPLADIHDFNQRERDRWIAAQAAAVPAGARVLDVGAGTCPYRGLFAHTTYQTHDFKAYEGEKLGGGNAYGAIDYVSDITALPIPDGSFDVVLCTEVLEHVPEPIAALREMARVLRPGGKLIVTAPLGSGLHQLPFHFYGGYTPHWYEKFMPQFGVRVESITPNGGFYRLMAQECNRAGALLPATLGLDAPALAEAKRLLQEVLPRFFFAVEDRAFVDQFTIGYHVVGTKV
jgi:FkbM family methyltransferase